MYDSEVNNKNKTKKKIANNFFKNKTIAYYNKKV